MGLHSEARSLARGSRGWRVKMLYVAVLEARTPLFRDCRECQRFRLFFGKAAGMCEIQGQCSSLRYICLQGLFNSAPTCRYGESPGCDLQTGFPEGAPAAAPWAPKARTGKVGACSHEHHRLQPWQLYLIHIWRKQRKLDRKKEIPVHPVSLVCTEYRVII